MHIIFTHIYIIIITEKLKHTMMDTPLFRKVPIGDLQ